MSGFVLDASCAVATLLSDEAGAQGEAILRRISRETPWVPPLWFTETGNALETARRRKHITSGDLTEILQNLVTWSVSVDHEDPLLLLPRIISLAKDHELTVYDATYLELAGRLAVPLATFDAKLADRAAKAGIPVLA